MFNGRGNRSWCLGERFSREHLVSVCNGTGYALYSLECKIPGFVTILTVQPQRASTFIRIFEIFALLDYPCEPGSESLAYMHVAAAVRSYALDGWQLCVKKYSKKMLMRR